MLWISGQRITTVLSLLLLIVVIVIVIAVIGVVAFVFETATLYRQLREALANKEPRQEQCPFHDNNNGNNDNSNHNDNNVSDNDNVNNEGQQTHKQ